MGTDDARAPHAIFVVARGRLDVLAEIRAFVEELGWVEVIEDRRRESTLLARSDRQGKLYLAP